VKRKNDYRLAKITQRTVPGGLTKAFACACGHEHVLGVYVFAHWNDALVNTCEKCGRKNVIKSGVVQTPHDAPAKAVRP
jgi:transcription elongation factor Elf1